MTSLVKRPLFTALKCLHLETALLFYVKDFVHFGPALLVYKGLCCMSFSYERNFSFNLFGWHFEEGLHFSWLHDRPPVVLVFPFNDVVALCRVGKRWYSVSWLKFYLTSRSDLVRFFLGVHGQSKDILHFQGCFLHPPHVPVVEFLSICVACFCLGSVFLEWDLLATSWNYELICCLFEVDFKVLVFVYLLSFSFNFCSIEALFIRCFVPVLIIYSD